MLSMTAYSRQAKQYEWGHLVWEIRSVNHRHFDLFFKIPDIFRECEALWRKKASEQLHRGKIEMSLTFLPTNTQSTQLTLNQELVQQLITHCQAISKGADLVANLNPMDVLRFPGAIVAEPLMIDDYKQPITELLAEALIAAKAVRLKEGEAIAQFLKGKLDLVQQALTLVESRKLNALQAQRQKLFQHLEEIKALDEHRLEQELVFYAQRMDIEEEIDRLKTHVKEVNRLLTTTEPMGRRLDFLMQEMMREANTLGAKAADHQISQASIDLKVIIEQMREQIQNVE